MFISLFLFYVQNLIQKLIFYLIRLLGTVILFIPRLINMLYIQYKRKKAIEKNISNFSTYEGEDLILTYNYGRNQYSFTNKGFYTYRKNAFKLKFLQQINYYSYSEIKNSMYLSEIPANGATAEKSNCPIFSRASLARAMARSLRPVR